MNIHIHSLLSLHADAIYQNPYALSNDKKIAHKSWKFNEKDWVQVVVEVREQKCKSLASSLRRKISDSAFGSQYVVISSNHLPRSLLSENKIKISIAICKQEWKRKTSKQHYKNFHQINKFLFASMIIDGIRICRNDDLPSKISTECINLQINRRSTELVY